MTLFWGEANVADEDGSRWCRGMVEPSSSSSVSWQRPSLLGETLLTSRAELQKRQHPFVRISLLGCQRGKEEALNVLWSRIASCLFS